MKKKILIITSVLFVISLIVAVVFFFLMKGAQPDDQNNDTEQTETEEYNVSHIVEKLKFLKFNTYDKIKEYADEYPVYIQTSDDDDTLFAIGELYIEDSPVTLFYSLNEDGSLKHFNGSCLMELSDKTPLGLQKFFGLVTIVVSDYFYVERFDHDIYDENSMPIDPDAEESYELMFDGKATFGISVIDEHNTYWYISASVTDEKQINFEFFRSFDTSAYSEDQPNIDLRITEETGE